MRIAIGNDHGGLVLRTPLIGFIKSAGHQVIDFGTDQPESVDYPHIAWQTAQAVRDGQADLGVVLCGTGIGSSICANKVEGVYCALCSDVYSARMARQHNGANLLSMGARIIGSELAIEILRTFVENEPSTEARHVRRRQQVQQIEAGNELAQE